MEKRMVERCFLIDSLRELPRYLQMGRRVSQSNYQGLTSTWAALLKPWITASKPGEVRRLATLLGVDWPLRGERAIIFRQAAAELHEVSGVQEGQDVSAGLEAWIQRHLGRVVN
jgi:hypothetical protein